MKLTNTDNSYGTVAILIHWLMAVAVIGLFALGKYMVGLDYYDAWYHSAPWWHKGIGFSVFALLIVRFGWRLSNTTVQPLPSHKAWEARAAHITHMLFYLVLFITCLSGYFISTAKGAPVEVFTWFELPPIIAYGQAQADSAGEVHEVATFVLLALFILHIAGALKHQFIDKDRTLVRMVTSTNLKRNNP